MDAFGIGEGLPEQVFVLQYRFPDLGTGWRSTDSAYLDRTEAEGVIGRITAEAGSKTEWRLMVLPCDPARAARALAAPPQ